MRLSALHARMLVVTIILFGVVATFSAVLTLVILHRHLTDEYVSKGSAIAESIAAQAAELILTRDPATIQAAMDQYLQIEGVSFVYVVDDAGRLVSHTFSPEPPAGMLGVRGDPSRITVAEMASPAAGNHIHITAPILAGAAGYVHVGMDKAIITRHLWSAGIKHEGLMLALFLASSAVLYLLVNRISRPLTELTEYAARLAAKDFAAPMEITAGGEVGALAWTMRFMAGEISGLVGGLTREVDRATSDLKETLGQLRAIIGNMADGLLVLDRDSRITLANPALGQMFGMDPATLPGQEADPCFGAVVADLAHSAMDSPGRAAEAEVVLGQGRTGKAAATAILDLPGGSGPKVRGAVLLFRDITREKEIDAIKTDFITTVSHELRTPLTSVLGFAKLIRRKLGQEVFPRLPDGSEETRKAVRQVNTNLHIITSEGQRLKCLIDDVLDISKMESGRVDWHMAPLSLSEAAADAAAATGPLYRRKGLRFGSNVPEDLPPVLGDRDRIIQVLVNLISNAVKFTSAGSINLAAEVDGDKVLVRVEDTGVGIALEHQERIFEKFRQAGDTLTEKPQGTGLGLAICKQIVEHHGGRIWVRSAPGAGSTFYFTLPLYPGAALDTACPIPD